VDLNGEVDDLDLALLIRLVFERSGEHVAGSDIPLEADVNADDLLTAADVTALMDVVGR
jgi:hypothetical protein